MCTRALAGPETTPRRSGVRMQREEALTVGTVAPDFTLLDQAERPWTLSEHLDAAAVVVFYRGDW